MKNVVKTTNLKAFNCEIDLVIKVDDTDPTPRTLSLMREVDEKLQQIADEYRINGDPDTVPF